MENDVHYYYNSPSAYIPTVTPSPAPARPPVPAPRSGPRPQQYSTPDPQHPSDIGQAEAPRGHQYEQLQRVHQYERLQHVASPGPIPQDYLITSEYLTTAPGSATYPSSGPYEQPPEPGCGTPQEVASDQPPPQQQQELQQRVVVFSAGRAVTVELVEPYDKHAVFACVVFWSYNLLFGLIAFFLASQCIFIVIFSSLILLS